MVSSIIIGNVVRYYAIKYGIDTPLLSHPILFSSAAGISSFLSILSRITIEDIFNLFEYKQLAMIGGEPNVLSKIPERDTAFKMESHSDGMASKNTIQTSDNKMEDIVASMDFSKLDNLLDSFKTNIKIANGERLKKIEEDITHQMNLLGGLSAKAQETHIPDHRTLVVKFLGLEHRFSDAGAEIAKVMEIIGKDKGSPSESLLDSDPEQFYKNKIKFVNRVREGTNQQCKIIKDYVKNNKLLTPSEKEVFFTRINSVKKGAANLADADNAILKKQLENSAILTELKKN